MIRLVFTLLTLAFFSACSDDDPPPSGPVVPEYAHVQVIVRSSLDSLAISSAEVSVYNAVTNAPVASSLTNVDGYCSFSIDAGSCYLRIAAQGFYRLPPEGISPVPFTAYLNDTVAKVYYLDTIGTVSSTGYISGLVRSDSTELFKVLPSILVIAQETVSGKKYSTATGVTGNFSLFNLPYGSYKLFAYSAGYALVDTSLVALSTQSAIDTIDLMPVSGFRLYGNITFLATQNASTLDITLLDSATSSAIPGLATEMDASKTYSISKIPSGRYLAWASYKNDGYVMDPDWLFKSGYPMVSFSSIDTLQQVSFSVTGAISILSPTNPNDSIYPVSIDTLLPTFQWVKYPSAKEYIVEVMDLNGRIVWGGYNRSDSTVRHAQIPADSSSITYNFDNSAVAVLVPGKVYRWKIYADNGAASKIQGLISSSEDQKGLFIVRRK
jgi:hypothetical protein